MKQGVQLPPPQPSWSQKKEKTRQPVQHPMVLSMILSQWKSSIQFFHDTWTRWRWRMKTRWSFSNDKCWWWFWGQDDNSNDGMTEGAVAIMIPIEDGRGQWKQYNNSSNIIMDNASDIKQHWVFNMTSSTFDARKPTEIDSNVALVSWVMSLDKNKSGIHLLQRMQIHDD